MAELEARMKDIAKDVRIVFACDHGAGSSRAADLYTKRGYTASTCCVPDEWKASAHKIGPTARPASGEIKPGAAKQQASTQATRLRKPKNMPAAISCITTPNTTSAVR